MGKRRGIDLMMTRPPCLSRTAGHQCCGGNDEKYDKTSAHQARPREQHQSRKLMPKAGGIKSRAVHIPAFTAAVP
jgi:hypothetical protein